LALRTIEGQELFEALLAQNDRSNCFEFDTDTDGIPGMMLARIPLRNFDQSLSFDIMHKETIVLSTSVKE
jgi:hypothetical protein